MKKTPALAAMLVLIAAIATGCGANGVSGTSDAEAQAWFTKNCPTQTTNIREDVVQGKPGGATIGQAIIQGPIKPPADLDSSTKRIGLYSYDKLSGQMKQEGELKSDDTFCLDPGTRHDASQRMNFPETQSDYTLLRSPKYAEGIWVGLHMSDLPEGFSVTENLEEKCALGWWPDKELISLDGAETSSEEIAKYALTTADDCS